ncbi:DUF1206 domain-containing protein [Cohnella ginsengisoli]|uniref:DUF1206 domain-containing protein n=1 Tax=Cohnella ginsengisoli TaxID=425004 RepID=UPI003B8A8999
MGLFSVKLALGAGGQATDQQGAIAAIGKQHVGWIFLLLLLIGLVCYSLWGARPRLVRSPPRRPRSEGNSRADWIPVQRRVLWPARSADIPHPCRRAWKSS